MDYFSTAVLTRTINTMFKPTSWLLDRYFPDTITFTSEEVVFDVVNGKRRMSPFVSPLVQGKIVESLGRSTNSLKPAYIKDKRVFDMTRPFKRRPGEMLLGDMSPEQRVQAMIAQEMDDQLDMFTRRQEWMAAQTLVYGGYTIAGEKYQTVVINFGRASAQQIVLTGGAVWGTAGVSLLGNLNSWASAQFQTSGVYPTDVVLDPAAWEIFRKDPEVKAERAYFSNPAPVRTTEGLRGLGGQLVATIGNFDIYVYQERYVDDNNTEQPMLPANTVLLLSPQIEGVRHYGAIKDHEVLAAVPYHVKSWLEQDPSVRYMLFQSAPLVAPYRVNASTAARVA